MKTILDIKEDIIQGMEEVRLHKEGKLVLKSAEELLSTLD
jgi:hypothetical protein